MKFIVSSTGLFSHLQAISRVINSKNSLPILDCFLMELTDGTLSLTASDSETTLSTSLEVNESDGDGRFAVSSKTILEALKEIPEQPLTFLVNTENLEITVQYQNGKYSLMGQNADEYPQAPALGANAVHVTMGAPVMLAGINRSLFATADDELRPVMNGIYFDITTEDITFVASDGHKLVRNKTFVAHGDEKAAFILPKKPATLLKNLLPKEQGDVQIDFDDRNATFTLENYSMISVSYTHLDVYKRQAIENVEKVLGNAVKTLKDPNLAAIVIGSVLGLILGSSPIAIPGISTPVKLGLAGGPIVVGILIGCFGPRFHLITYTTRSANLMLRGIGLSLYLACLGLDAGAHFFETVMRPEGAIWIAVGFAITFIPVVIMALVALRISHLDFGSTCGMLCGSMANPMALNYANDIDV